MSAQSLQGLKIHIQGIVQGVGFRPFIYTLAQKHKLMGWVKNTSAGVIIEITGSQVALESFLTDIEQKVPPLASIDRVEIEQITPIEYQDFKIVESTSLPDQFIPISADVSVCADCLDELFDSRNRRYRYPFINCTNCGPRYTIIQDIPYDRPFTTMSSFEMCADCYAEYSDPSDRRFHAQPIACPACGPHVWLEKQSGRGEPANSTQLTLDSAIEETQSLLANGSIVAIKGLGGFHLACDALNNEAVDTLRARKLRIDKPFAVMMPDLATIEKHCYLNDEERKILLSKERPIMILKRRPEAAIAGTVAPNQDTLGVMLPYTPLHYLLFTATSKPGVGAAFEALVMTSGNLSEEPIAFKNEESKERLSGLADAFLFHDRDIYIRCDDSVGRVVDFATLNPATENDRKISIVLRRARGYSPTPLVLPWESIPLLAVGAELKNTFCLARDRYAFISHYIGDMQNFETYQSFVEGIRHLEHIFRITPEVIAYDSHPDYLGTRYAQEWAAEHKTPAIRIQHHHAHITAVMAEYGLPKDTPVIGVALDGTGYGEDGNIWGGEFLIATYQDYQRKYHLEYLPLPGGDLAIKQPAKTALAYLWKMGIDWDPDLGCVQHFCAQDQIRLKAQLTHQINTPLTSSMGRLFDAVSSLLNIRHTINYEAQAAIELEAITDPDEQDAYPFEIDAGSIRIGPLLHKIVEDVLGGVTPRVISARFHNTIAHMVVEVAIAISRQTGIRMVALSGGVWQNMRLLKTTHKDLESLGFTVLFHRQAPTNDSGISLGQAAIAHHIYQSSIEIPPQIGV